MVTRPVSAGPAGVPEYMSFSCCAVIDSCAAMPPVTPWLAACGFCEFWDELKPA